MGDFEDLLATSDANERASELGARPALIERFGIRSLYGYRTISLSSRHSATILIAKNGTGKTTLLGALDAFLKLQLYRLRGLEFREIFCKIRGIEDELVLSSDDLLAFLQPPTEGEFAKLIGRSGIEQQKLFQFILSDYATTLEESYTQHDAHSTAYQVIRGFGYDQRAAKKACDEAYSALFRRNENLNKLREGIRDALREYEIVYLPTYRRVELALTDEGEDRRRHPGRVRPKLSIAASGLHTGDIQFGLRDISERLSQLNSQIISRSNQGYREISENIINELIQGFEVSDDTAIPRPEDLKLFFSRLETGRRTIGGHYRISAPDFNRIYSGEGVPPESRKFLTYFLGKLNGIINITKEIEQPVGDFIASCNRYLSASEPSTFVQEAPHQGLTEFDAKALKVNRTNLSVHVESVPARTPISLDALSSGEKQMISLFAKMYLYPKKKIVLIDEPELSLSIDWQRGILVDVLLSPHCEQIVAITHSPFVFDNSLEQFARTLDLKLENTREPELDLSEISDFAIDDRSDLAAVDDDDEEDEDDA